MPPGLEREHEERRAVVALELVDELLPPADGRAAVQDQSRAAEDAREKAAQRFGHFAELGEDQRLLLPRGDLFANLGQPRELAAFVRHRTARRPAVARDGCTICLKRIR